MKLASILCFTDLNAIIVPVTSVVVVHSEHVRKHARENVGIMCATNAMAHFENFGFFAKIKSSKGKDDLVKLQSFSGEAPKFAKLN